MKSVLVGEAGEELAEVIFLVFAAAMAVQQPPALTARDVREIRATCHLPRSWLWYRKGAVHMTPPKDADQDRIECMLREAVKQFPNVGFVGNEEQLPAD